MFLYEKYMYCYCIILKNVKFTKIFDLCCLVRVEEFTLL